MPIRAFCLTQSLDSCAWLFLLGSICGQSDRQDLAVTVCIGIPAITTVSIILWFWIILDTEVLANALWQISGHTHQKISMTTNSVYDDDYHSPLTDPWDAPTPGNSGRTPASLYSPSPALDCATDQQRTGHLNFLPSSDWIEGSEYDVLPPRYVCYTLAWKLILNRTER